MSACIDIGNGIFAKKFSVFRVFFNISVYSDLCFRIGNRDVVYDLLYFFVILSRKHIGNLNSFRIFFI